MSEVIVDLGLTKEMLRLSIDEVRDNPKQVRKSYDQGKLRALADSIKEIGLDTPMQFIWHPNDDGKKVTIKDGHRRIRALKLLDVKELRYGEHYIIVGKFFSDDKLEIGVFVANCLREDLTPAEKGHAFMKLLKKVNIPDINVALNVISRAKDFLDNNFIAEPSSRNFYIPKETVKEVARYMKIVGISGTNAQDLLKLTQLPEDIQRLVIFAPSNTRIKQQEKMKISRRGTLIERRLFDREDFIPMRIATELARLKDEPLIRFFLEEAKKGTGWTSKKTHLMVEDYQRSNLPPDQYIKAYGRLNTHTVRSIQKRRENIDGFINEIDSFTSTLTSFRTINMVALAEDFKKKEFAISGVGLQTATKKLLNALDGVLLTTKELIKVKEEERQAIKLPFRVRLTKPPKTTEGFRFTIKKELAEQIAEQLNANLGDELELQVNAIIKPATIEVVKRE